MHSWLRGVYITILTCGSVWLHEMVGLRAAVSSLGLAALAGVKEQEQNRSLEAGIRQEEWKQEQDNQED